MSSLEVSPAARGNMNDWADALRHRHYPGLAARLEERRSLGFDRLETLGLPRYKRQVTNLLEFISDTTSVTRALDSDLFYISLIPLANDLRRFSASGLNEAQVLAYIDSTVDKSHFGDYDITVQQFFENHYGGSIIINPSGRVRIEFVRGKQGPVARGGAKPEFVAKNDQFTGTMRYNFEDYKLREAAYGALQAIPHQGSGRATTYLPGYYEFVLVSPRNDGNLSPIFIDCKDEPIYYLPE